jgi:hypothetical protein
VTDFDLSHTRDFVTLATYSISHLTTYKKALGRAITVTSESYPV